MFTLQIVSPSKMHNIGESDFVQTYPKESFLLSDPDNSPIESILYYCCGIINEARNYSFTINLEGSSLCLPIKPELSIFLGQVGPIATFLRASHPEPLVVDFFEQGHEFQFVLSKSDNCVDVRMNQKHPEVVHNEQIPIDAFESSLCRFVLTLIHVVGVLDLKQAKNSPFASRFIEYVVSPRPSIPKASASFSNGSSSPPVLVC